MSRRKRRTTAAAMAVATAALLTATGAPAAVAQARPTPGKHSASSAHAEKSHSDRKQAQQDYVENVTEARRVLALARAEVTEQSRHVKELRASVEAARASWEEAVESGDEALAYEWSRDLAVRTDRYESARIQLREMRRTFKHEAQRDYRAAVKAAQQERDAAFR